MLKVDQVVDTERSQDQTAGQVPDNRDTIHVAGIGAKDDRQADNDAEHITSRPPGVVGVGSLDVADDGRDERNEPCQNGDGEGCEREGIAEDVARAEFGHFGRVCRDAQFRG